MGVRGVTGLSRQKAGGHFGCPFGTVPAPATNATVAPVFFVRKVLCPCGNFFMVAQLVYYAW